MAGQPMPNYKGGFMSYAEGYEFALLIFLVALVWFYSAVKYLLMVKKQSR